MDDLKRLSRLTSILIQLQSKRLLTATMLADKYGVSARTIYRDMRSLEQSGVPIITEEGKGYRLMEGYKIPPVMFTESEANALITAEFIIKASKDESLIEVFSQAIDKIKAVVPNQLKIKAQRLEEKLGVTKTYINPSPKSKYLLELQQALDHMVVKVNYLNANAVTSVRELEPFAIFSNQYDDWVLVAYCRLRKEFRSFSLTGILTLTYTGEKFNPHPMTFAEFRKITYGN